MSARSPRTYDVEKVPTEDNIADMLTKALDPGPFHKLRALLMNLVVRVGSASYPRSKRHRG